jgi:hypothetical protein
MIKNLTDFIFDKSQEETERQLFGANIYSSAHKFPSIYITNRKQDLEYNEYNLESFTKYTKLINNISNNCGSDLALLFGEIYNIYKIDNESITLDQQIIIDFCTESLAHLSLAMKQSDQLINNIETSFDNFKKSNYEIEGKDYCFIVMMLNNLFYYYSTIVNLIIQKRYLNIEFIRSISERLSFIVSEEFETIRRIFKVIECYKEVEPKKTFH